MTTTPTVSARKGRGRKIVALNNTVYILSESKFNQIFGKVKSGKINVFDDDVWKKEHQRECDAVKRKVK